MPMKTKVKRPYRLGFDLGGTKILAAVFDRKFRIVASRRRKSKDLKGSRAGLAAIAKTIQEALEEAGVSARQLEAIGVGCPAPLDLDQGVILQAPNLGWRNVPLKTWLQNVFHCPVEVANDVDAGTYGEFRFGAARGARCVVGVFPGTGIGGACVYNGRLLRGRVSSCMEIGHLCVEPGGRLCGCGRHGCLETVASRLAISAEAAAAAYRGQAPYLRETAGLDLGAIRSRALASSIKAGDTAIELIVRRAAHCLGLAMASVVNLLAPDRVVLGGGLVEAMPRLYVEEVHAAIQSQAMPPLARGVKVVAAELGDNATAMGAAALGSEAAEGEED